MLFRSTQIPRSCAVARVHWAIVREPPVAICRICWSENTGVLRASFETGALKVALMGFPSTCLFYQFRVILDIAFWPFQTGGCKHKTCGILRLAPQCFADPFRDRRNFPLEARNKRSNHPCNPGLAAWPNVRVAVCTPTGWPESAIRTEKRRRKNAEKRDRRSNP